MNAEGEDSKTFRERIHLLWEDFRFRPPYRIQRALTFAGAAALFASVLLTRYLPANMYQSDVFAAAAIMCIFGPFAVLGLVSIIYRSFLLPGRELRGKTAIILGALQSIFFGAFVLWALVRLILSDYP